MTTRNKFPLSCSEFRLIHGELTHKEVFNDSLYSTTKMLIIVEKEWLKVRLAKN